MPWRIKIVIQEKNSNLDRDQEVRGSNPGPGSKFSLYFKITHAGFVHVETMHGTTKQQVLEIEILTKYSSLRLAKDLGPPSSLKRQQYTVSETDQIWCWNYVSDQKGGVQCCSLPGQTVTSPELGHRQHHYNPASSNPLKTWTASTKLQSGRWQ